MTLLRTNVFWLLFLALSMGFGTAAWGAPMTLVDPQLAGSTQYDEWAAGSLTSSANPGYPGFPGSGAWPAPIGSSAAGSGDANLNKVANGNGGGPYPAGAAIYYGGFSADINNNGGTLSVTDVTPVADVSNIVLQIQIGEAWTYDFWNAALPTLSYNGGTQDLAADDAQLLEAFFNGTVTMPTGEEAVYINTYLLQWDLSSLGSITDVSLKFTGVQHAQLYALRLDQSDEYSPAVVPEPSALALAGMAGMGLLVACRTRRRSAA
jgi:hypothetical protein